jgi:hypothetical protein
VFRAAAREARDLVDEAPLYHAIHRVADELLDRFDVDGATVRAALAGEQTRWG